MAYEVNANGAIAKVRNPWGVLGLTLITLGIYGIFWYYYLNKEFKEFGAAMGDQELAASNPVNSVLAVTIGIFILVPPFVSYYNFVKRGQRVQQLGGVEPLSGWIALIIFLVIGIAFSPFIQSEMNKVWERYPALEGGAGEIPAAQEAPAVPAQQPAAQETPPPPPPPAQ